MWDVVGGEYVDAANWCICLSARTNFLKVIVLHFIRQWYHDKSFNNFASKSVVIGVIASSSSRQCRVSFPCSHQLESRTDGRTHDIQKIQKSNGFFS